MAVFPAKPGGVVHKRAFDQEPLLLVPIHVGKERVGADGIVELAGGVGTRASAPLAVLLLPVVLLKSD